MGMMICIHEQVALRMLLRGFFSVTKYRSGQTAAVYASSRHWACSAWFTPHLREGTHPPAQLAATKVPAPPGQGMEYAPLYWTFTTPRATKNSSERAAFIQIVAFMLTEGTRLCEWDEGPKVSGNDRLLSCMAHCLLYTVLFIHLFTRSI